MKIIYYEHQKKEELGSEHLQSRLDLQSGVTWIDIRISDESDMRFLHDAFDFHPLTIEDLYHQQQRPKAEEFLDYLFVILNPVHYNNDELSFRELGVFVGSNYLLTAHMEDEPIITELEKRLDPKRTHLPLSPTYLLYVLMDAVLDAYLPVMENIETQMDKLGDDILIKPNTKMLTQISQCKQDLNEFWRVIWPQQDIINVLTNHGLVFIDDKSLYYLRDVSDHLARLQNNIQVDRDTVSGLINIYMSSISNQLNYAVGRLTLLTIAVGIFAVFSGFYGMNFDLTWPPFSAPWGVPMVLFMIIVVTLATFGFLRWKKWI